MSDPRWTVGLARPDDPHEWEPPDDRRCAICGIDLDDHPEPALSPSVSSDTPTPTGQT